MSVRPPARGPSAWFERTASLDGSGRLEDAAAMAAPDGPDRKRDNQNAARDRQHPKMFADMLMMRQDDIFVKRGYRRHARQHMRRRPDQDRRDVDAVEPQRRHAQRPGRDRHEGADR